MKKFLSFIGLIIFCTSLFGQNGNQLPLKRCPVKTINFEQGLINNSITSAITDESGFTWISTIAGLQKFDGYKLETINPVVDGETIIINYSVYFLKTANNNILIGYRKGILEYDAKKNSFKKIISVSPKANLHQSIIPVIKKNNQIWCIQEKGGLLIYNKNNVAIKHFVSDKFLNIDSVVNSSNFFLSDIKYTANDNYIFLGVSLQNILQINLNTQEVKLYNCNNSIIYYLLCNSNDLFISCSTGLFKTSINDANPVLKFSFDNFSRGQFFFSSLDFINKNELLVSFDKHLYQFDTACTLKSEFTNFNKELLLYAGSIRKVYHDNLNRIWVITNDDIKRIQNAEIPFEHFTYGDKSNNFIRSIYVDEQKNRVLAGCFNGGIQLYDTLGNPLWDKPVITNQVKDILAIEKLSNNDYLIETISQGLYILDINTKKLQPLNILINSSLPKNINENNFSNSLKRINDSTILLNNNSNLFKCVFKNNHIESVKSIFNISTVYGMSLSCFKYIKNKDIWVGTQQGAILISENNGTQHSINIPGNYGIRCMEEDAANNIWVGTEKGLYIYTSFGQLLKQITTEQGLLNDFIYALLPTKNKNDFFASTNFGLTFISAKGNIKNFTKELGLQENEFNTQAAAQSASGKLFFGGINGITAFYPASLFITNDSPFINITRFVVNDSVYKKSFFGAWQNDSIRLSYNQNHLQLDLAATGLLNPNEYNYQYRLNGFENLWQTTHQPTGIRYTLEPGTYYLEVNCNPLLSSNKIFYKKFVIIIDAPWWQTWWFRILAFVALVAATALSVLRYNKRKYQNKIIALQMQGEIQNERERISKELHDNIGTQLSYISSNVDWMLDAQVNLSRQDEVKRLQVVNSTAKEMIADLRETIWAIKKEAVQLDELADRLKLFIQSQIILQPKMQINISEDIKNNMHFTPIEALNIFRICQEAIVNSIKHAKASILNLSIQSFGKTNFSISITDNGIGFDNNKIYSGHYGLENMQSRAKELGVKLLILSEPGKGTNICLSKA